MFDREIIDIEMGRLQVVKCFAGEYKDLVKLVEDILNWNEYCDEDTNPSKMLTEVICSRMKMKEIDND